MTPEAHPPSSPAPARGETSSCEFAGGRRVLANATLELEGGRIVRELDVLSGDPKGA